MIISYKYGLSDSPWSVFAVPATSPRSSVHCVPRTCAARDTGLLIHTEGAKLNVLSIQEQYFQVLQTGSQGFRDFTLNTRNFTTNCVHACRTGIETMLIRWRLITHSSCVYNFEQVGCHHSFLRRAVCNACRDDPSMLENSPSFCSNHAFCTSIRHSLAVDRDSYFIINRPHADRLIASNPQRKNQEIQRKGPAGALWKLLAVLVQLENVARDCEANPGRFKQNGSTRLSGSKLQASYDGWKRFKTAGPRARKPSAGSKLRQLQLTPVLHPSPEWLYQGRSRFCWGGRLCRCLH